MLDPIGVTISSRDDQSKVAARAGLNGFAINRKRFCLRGIGAGTNGKHAAYKQAEEAHYDDNILLGCRGIRR